MLNRNILSVICILGISTSSFAYEVKEGETLKSIAEKYYNVPVAKGLKSLQDLNSDIAEEIAPGAHIKLNQELLKAQYKNDPELKNEEAAEVQADSDSEEGLSPAIEIEKYNDPKNKGVKQQADDKINFFAGIVFNSLSANTRATNVKFSFNTASETEAGFQYVKYSTPSTSYFATVLVNTFSAAAVPTFTPPLESNYKSQVAGSLGLHYTVTPEYLIDLAYNYRPHYYLINNDTGAMILRHALSSSVGLQLENHFNISSEFVTGLQVGAEYISNAENSGSGDTDGTSFELGFLYQQEFKSNDLLRVKIGYQQTNLNSILYTLVDESVKLTFLYSLPY